MKWELEQRIEALETVLRELVDSFYLDVSDNGTHWECPYCKATQYIRISPLPTQPAFEHAETCPYIVARKLLEQ